MNKIKRILSIILCISMLLPLFQDFVMFTSAEDDPVLNITLNGEKVSNLNITQSERFTLTAKASKGYGYSYQWQILIDPMSSVWANIYDLRSSEAEVHYALICTLLDSSDSAYLRCKAVSDDSVIYSDPVCVTVIEKMPVAEENVKLSVSKLMKSAPLMAAPNGDDDDDDEPEYVNFTINYLSADNPTHKVYQSYTSKIAANAVFSQNVISPTQIGFAPFYTGSTGSPVLAEGGTVTVTHDGEEREYTYTGGSYMYDGAAETDSDWLAAIEIQVIADTATTAAGTIAISFDPDVDSVEDVVYNVYYKAIQVPFSVKYYFQNINDDAYTQNAAIFYNGMALTGTIVDDETLYNPVLEYFGVTDPNADYGFSPLYHYPESVAADGSTVFECYYDRNYYLMKFDMDGGYGVEPIYARYGASFVVTPPTKPGYVFKGWDEVTHYTFDVFALVNGNEIKVGSVNLTPAEYAEKGNPSAYMEDYDNGVNVYPNAVFRFSESHGNGVPDVATLSPYNYIGTIEARNVSYKAIWAQADANVTVIYWKENANDENYSFWGIANAEALSATSVSAKNIAGVDYSVLPASLAAESDSNQFFFNSTKSDTNVFVEGDGSSIVNVYFDRKVHSITFLMGNTCLLDEHTHTDACYGYLCGEHVHTPDCLICGLPELPHTSDCCSIQEHVHDASCQVVCTIPEHTHTDSCYGCGLELHVHDASCCDREEHSHDGTNCNYLICTTPLNTTHTHTSACYGNCPHVHNPSCYGATSFTEAEDVTGNALTGLNAVIRNYPNPISGRLYSYCYRPYNSRTYYNYFYCDGAWYYIGTSDRDSNSVNGLAWGGGDRNNNNGSMSQSTTTVQPNRCNHVHTSACMTCTIHTEHTDTCYACGHASHQHTPACYPDATNTAATNAQKNGVPGNPKEGQVYQRPQGGFPFYTTYNKIIYINGQWYQYDGNAASGTVISSTCGKTAHTHSASCCTKEAHRHGDGHCHYNCGLTEHPAHDVSCLICGFNQEHAHSELCQYTCGKIAHVHSDDCCSIEAHTHSRDCLQIGGNYRVDWNTSYQLSLGSAYQFSDPTKVGTVTINGIVFYYDTTAGAGSQFLYVKAGEWYYRLQYNNGRNTVGVQNTSTDRGYINYNANNRVTLTYTCGKSEHIHNGKDCNYICGYEEEHVHTDSCYVCGIPGHIHGVDECNGDICTDPTHHRHTDSCYGCGYTSDHVHDETCPRGLVCGYHYEHSHDDDPSGSKPIYKVDAKYDADISGIWEKMGLYDDSPIKGYLDQGYVWKSSITSNYYSFLEKMPNRDVDMTATLWSGDLYTWYYYLEVLQGMDTTGLTLRTDGGKTYYLYHTTSVKGNGISLTYDEDYFPITGFSQKSTTVPSFSNRIAYLYYNRQIAPLIFYNVSETVSSTNLYYQTPIDSYVSNIGVPPYPSTYEPGAYYFDGWYTTPGCYPGTEYVPGTVLPADGLTLYAHYAPVTHTVRFFETYDVMLEYEMRASVINANASLSDADKEAAIMALDSELVYKKQSMTDAEYKCYVEHGKFVGSIPNPDKLLVTNPGGSTSEYDFNGWFMIENEAKKAFTPLDMPITRDINVFADWGTHTAQPYAVHYALFENEIDSDWLALLDVPSKVNENKEFSVTHNNANRTYICLNDGTEDAPVYRWHRIISDVTRGYAYQGTTRTFAARAGETYHQLYDAYDIDFNDSYYPTPASHSITMAYEEDSLEPISNVFTFRYVYVDEVAYTVRYLDAVTGEPLHDEKTVFTGNAVVTERFIPIEKDGHNYIPDAFYKQCILAVVEDENNPGHYISSPENVITFYYSLNDTSARYTVHFMMQKADAASTTLDASDYEIEWSTDGTYSFSNKFEESGSRIEGIADKNSETYITPIRFAGFDLMSDMTASATDMTACYYLTYDDSDEFAQFTAHDSSYVWDDGDCIIYPSVGGTDLFFFYTREAYPYKVYYLLYGAPVATSDLATYITEDGVNVLADTDGIDPVLTELYGRDFTATAKDINGYVCVSETEQSKPITPNEASNYIIFFYTPEQYTVQYEVVGDIGGTLSNTIETFAGNAADSIEGSTATADSGYKFVGWFVDEECTVPATFDGTSNPGGKGTTYTDSTKAAAAEGETGLYVYPDVTKLIPNGQTGDDTNIFYAKFEPLAGDLTITRANSANEGNGNQVFVYEISDKDGNKIYVSITGNGSVTVHDLLFGDYTVTQMNDWSHRFGDAAQTITLNQPTGTEVTFDDDAVSVQWLNGNGSVAKNTKG